MPGFINDVFVQVLFTVIIFPLVLFRLYTPDSYSTFILVV